MGRAPCCDKASVKKGPWSPEEDAKLKEFIEKFGTGGNWIALPQKAGLKRCGKSCRLRWLNYLRPNIRHGEFSDEEDRIICSLYTSIGSRWSVIAAQLPGRTDNDIKNYWNTKLKKKLLTSFQDKQSFLPCLQPFQLPPPYDHHASHQLLMNTSSSFYTTYNAPNFMDTNSNSLFVQDDQNNINVTDLSPPPPHANSLMSNINNIDVVNDNYCYNYLGFQDENHSMSDSPMQEYYHTMKDQGMLMFGSSTTGSSSEGGISQMISHGNYNNKDHHQVQKQINYQIKQEEDYQITTLHDDQLLGDQIQNQTTFMIKNHVTPILHNDIVEEVKQLNFSSYLFHGAS